MRTIDLTMTADTISYLRAQNFALYAFKALQTAVSGGLPSIWLATRQFQTDTRISWQPEYAAFISQTAIMNHVTLSISSMASVSLGQTAKVNPDRFISTGPGGPEGGVSIVNASPMPWTAGFAQHNGQQQAPTCALPLGLNAMAAVAPVEKVLLMFGQAAMPVGTLTQTAFSQGALVDLTASPNATVSYDINVGWKGGQGISPGTNLTNVLFQH
jgi:hypothetical protein